MKQYPEPVVGIFILNPQGEIFLMKSHKWNNLYVVPGGHIEVGETIEQAVKREAKEETGLDVFDPKFICIQEYMAEGQYWKKKHMLFLNYLVKTESKDVHLNDEAENYVWVHLEEALKLPLEKYTRITLENYISKL